MKSILPGRFELMLFIAMAFVAGALAAWSPQRSTMLFALTMPIFLVAALMGFRRSQVAVPVKESEEETAAANRE
ncbi:MAG TPA: hypothetical protein VFE47_01970 [Tepidisphaeraceae bacterium]|jgi:hypothetical protein|nr:hypothetical protein [Tepidisphaeraceae bacterium]